MFSSTFAPNVLVFCHVLFPFGKVVANVAAAVVVSLFAEVVACFVALFVASILVFVILSSFSPLALFPIWLLQMKWRTDSDDTSENEDVLCEPLSILHASSTSRCPRALFPAQWPLFLGHGHKWFLPPLALLWGCRSACLWVGVRVCLGLCMVNHPVMWVCVGRWSKWGWGSGLSCWWSWWWWVGVCLLCGAAGSRRSLSSSIVGTFQRSCCMRISQRAVGHLELERSGGEHEFATLCVVAMSLLHCLHSCFLNQPVRHSGSVIVVCFCGPSFNDHLCGALSVLSFHGCNRSYTWGPRFHLRASGWCLWVSWFAFAIPRIVQLSVLLRCFQNCEFFCFGFHLDVQLLHLL